MAVVSSGWRSTLLSQLRRMLALGAVAFVSSTAFGKITVTPTDAVVTVGATRAFSATRDGRALTNVVWLVNGTAGGTAVGGTIDAGGVYRAPSAVPATNPVRVTAQAAKDQGSANVTIRAASPPPLPVLGSVAPTTVSIGSFTLTVSGSNFITGAIVQINGAPVSTTFVSSTQLTANATATQAGMLTVRVANPGGGISTAQLQVSVSSANPPPAPPPPLTDAATISAARFLEQATFGVSPTDLVSVKQSGFAAWIAEQQSLPVTPVTAVSTIGTLQRNWYTNMVTAPDQLRQRVTFALSQVMVVSDTKNTNADELQPWLTTLSNNALGNFGTLLREMTLNPAMGKYLDLGNSVMPVPNENYAREVMQLMTIGLVMLNQDGTPKLDGAGNPIPTYDQAVIHDMARSLSGWTYPGTSATGLNWENFTGPLQPRDSYHDHGAKVLLMGQTLPAGRTIVQDYDAVMTMLFNHPNVPPFVATRLIRALVTSNPSPPYVRSVADVFANNGQGVRGDLAATVKAILLDPEARQDVPTATQGKLKDPLLHSIGLIRALSGVLVDPTNMFWDYYLMNERLFEAPSVFSFYSPMARLPTNPALYGPEFQIYPGDQAILRANFLYNLLSGAYSSMVKIDITPFVNVAGNPAALIDLVDATLLQGRMSASTRQAIAAALASPSDARTNALTALHLAAIGADFAVHR